MCHPSSIYRFHFDISGGDGERSREKREFGRRELRGAGLGGWGGLWGGFEGGNRSLLPSHLNPLLQPFLTLPTMGLPSIKTMFPLVWNGKCFQHVPLQISREHPQGKATMATRGQRGSLAMAIPPVPILCPCSAPEKGTGPPA